jgi:hypothetical protein
VKSEENTDAAAMKGEDLRLRSQGLVRGRKNKDGEREEGPRDATMPQLPDRSEDSGNQYKQKRCNQ